MLRRSPLLALGALLAATGPAGPLAATEPETETADLVITAIPVKPEELSAAVDHFVTRISQVSDQGQLARRSGPYCPAVSGLDDKYVPIVLARLRAAAQAAGVKEAPAGCRSNLGIIFASDGDALMDGLYSVQPKLFWDLSAAKLRELFKSGRAVRWLYGKVSGAMSGEEAVDGVLKTYTASLVSTKTRINVTGTLVVIDAAKAEGYPLASVASFAAMASFAEISGRQDSFASVPSILGIFTRKGPRAQALKDLTAWDRAYLQALYTTPPDRSSFSQRRLIAGRMQSRLREEGGK